MICPRCKIGSIQLDSYELNKHDYSCDHCGIQLNQNEMRYFCIEEVCDNLQFVLDNIELNDNFREEIETVRDQLENELLGGFDE